MFVFPKDVLVNRGFLQGPGSQGVTSIYVYPPHIKPRRAVAAQEWQLDYFLDCARGIIVDRARARALFSAPKLTPPPV